MDAQKIRYWEEHYKESILYSIAKKIGIEDFEEMKDFEGDLIMDINSVFVKVNELGVGPEDPFYITDEKDFWEDFIPDGDIEMVKSYIAMNVKLLFDPPANSFLVTNLKENIEEYGWRLRAHTETFG